MTGCWSPDRVSIGHGDLTAPVSRNRFNDARILNAMAPFAFHNLFTRVFRAMQRPRSTWTHRPAQAKPQTHGFTRGHKPKALARGHFLAILTALTLSHSIAKGDEIYTFDVFFDDRLIGLHQFVRSSSETGEEIVTSRASLALKILFFNAFKYEHSSREIWRDGCLVELEATTNTKKGEQTTTLRSQSGEPSLTVNGDAKDLPNGDSCLSSFAYWRTDLSKRTLLMNAQSGDFIPVEMSTSTDPETIERRTIISANKLNIEVRYDSRGKWIGLQTALSNDHQLTYRPKTNYASAR